MTNSATTSLQSANDLANEVHNLMCAVEHYLRTEDDQEGREGAILFLALNASSQAKEQLTKQMAKMRAQLSQFYMLSQAVGRVHRYSPQAPATAGWYWHWDGVTGHAPVVRQVCITGVSQRAYVAEGPGAAFYRYCDELGGFWKTLPAPTE